MKKYQLLLTTLLILVVVKINAQQCITNQSCSNFFSNFPTGTISPSTSWTTQGGMNGGNWTLFSVIAGNTYEWTYCESYGGVSTAWDAQLTLYDYRFPPNKYFLCFSDDVCGANFAPYLSWTATFTGTVLVLTSEFSCITNAPAGPWNRLAYRQVASAACSGAPSFQLFSPITFSPTSIPGGTYGTYSATVLNTGTSSGMFDFEMDVYDNGVYQYPLGKQCFYTVAPSTTVTVIFNSSSTDSHTVPSCVNGHVYTIRMTAICDNCFSCGNLGCTIGVVAPGSYSNPIPITVTGCCTPTVPSSCSTSIGLPANGLEHHTNLSCSAVAGVDGYSFEYSFNNSTWYSLSSGAYYSYDVNNGDNPNTAIYYRVRTYCGAVYSSYINASPLPIYTACDDPAPPTISGVTFTTMNITLNPESPVVNPSSTTYAIYCTSTGQYVQASGTLGAPSVYQTMTSWGTKTITGLSNLTSYCFYAYAKNAQSDVRFNSSNIGCGTTGGIQPPSPNFSSNQNNVSCGSSVNFSDLSSNGPTSWLWSFPGGSPSASSSQNPLNISYSSPGTHSVTLRVTNSGGSNSLTRTGYITVQSTSSCHLSSAPINSCVQSTYLGGRVAEPINVGTGSYEYNHTDLKNHCINGEESFTRFYDSKQGNQNGPLGYGWSHTFNYFVTNLGDSIYRVHYGDGHVSDYIPLYNSGGNCFALYGSSHEILQHSGGYTLRFKNQDLYNFDSNGVLLNITDRNGNITQMSYSGNDLTQVTLPGGRIWSLSYDGSGRILSISDPLSRTINYAYDGNGNLSSVTNAATHATTFSYDANHQITQITLPKGNILVSNTYDVNSNLTQQTDALGNLTIVAYDTPVLHAATVTYPGGATKIYYHDTFYRLVQETDEQGLNKYYVYDENNNRTSFTDENGNITTYAYDGNGNDTAIHQPLGVNTSFTYNSTNDVITRTDAQGHIITYGRDGNGNLTSISYPNATSRNFVVDITGQTTQYRDGLNHQTNFSYNSYGDLISESRPNGTYSYSYDAAGRKLSVTDPLANATNYSYDDIDNLTTVTDALSKQITFQFDANNNLIGKTDKMLLQTNYSYDTKDRLSGITDADANSKSFSYDSRDNLISSTDENAHTTTYGYDSKNRKTSLTNALNSGIQFQYDDVGNLLSATDANNVSVTNTYDALNRKTSESNSLNQASAFSYDNSGRMIQKTDPLGRNAQYNYDNVGLLLQLTDEAGQVSNYAYDANWNMTSIQDPNGHSQSIAYDNSNRPYIFTDADNKVTTRAYDNVGNISTITMPNGVVKNITYDNIYRPQTMNYSTGENYSFTYDDNNNIFSSASPAGTESFQYDNLNRRTQMTDVFSNNISFTYDAVGNRTSVVYPGSNPVNYQFNELNEMTSVSDWLNHQAQYNYDPTGRLLNLIYPNGTKCDYSFDARNRLTELNNYVSGSATIISKDIITLDGNSNRIQDTKTGVTMPSLPTQTYNYSYTDADMLTNDVISQYTNDANGNRTTQVTGGNTITYVFTANDILQSISSGASTSTYSYDALGNRVSKTVNGSQTRHVLDLSGNLSQVLQEQNSGGLVKANYIYGIGLLARIDSAGNISYYHFDADGNTVSLSDDSAHITDTYSYESFGKILNHTGNTEQPFCFLGKYGVQKESDSLYYVRARYYDSDAGRFLSKDIYPIAFNNSQSINRFVYGLNNPLLIKDYTGLYGNRDSDGLGSFLEAFHGDLSNLTGDFGFFSLGASFKGLGLLGNSGLGTIGKGFGVLGNISEVVSVINTSYQYSTGQISGFEAGLRNFSTGFPILTGAIGTSLGGAPGGVVGAWAGSTINFLGTGLGNWFNQTPLGDRWTDFLATTFY